MSAVIELARKEDGKLGIKVEKLEGGTDEEFKEAIRMIDAYMIINGLTDDDLTVN